MTKRIPNLKSGYGLAMCLVSALTSANTARAVITYQGESFPETTAEAQDLDYVRQTAPDPTGPGGERYSSYTNYVRWSDQRYPHADASYFTHTQLIDPNYRGTQQIAGETRTNNVFYGRRIILGKNGHIGLCGINTTPNTPITFGREGLFSTKATEVLNWAGDNVHVRGPFTILNAQTTHFAVMSYPNTTSTNTIHFHGAWTSRVETVVKFCRYPLKARSIGGAGSVLHGDTTGFLGTMVTETNSYVSLAHGLPNGTMRLGLDGYTGYQTSGLAPFASGLNGTLETCGANDAALDFKEIHSNGGTLAINATNRWNVATLRLNAGVCSFTANPSATNEASLTAASLVFEQKPVRLRLTQGTSFIPRDMTWKVLSAPRGDFSASDFTLENPDGLPYAFVDTDAASELHVALSASPIHAIAGGGLGEASAFLRGDCWEDGLVPHAGNDYIIALPRVFYPPLDDYVFPGRSLSLLNHASLYVDMVSATEFTCASMTISDAEIRSWRDTFTLSGGPIRLQGPFTACVYGGSDHTFSIASELVGDGNLTINSYPSMFVTGSGGTATLMARNTNYFGSITVTIPSMMRDYGPVPSLTRCTTLLVSDAAQLGAPRTSFTPDALQLEQMSVLKPLEDLTWATPNRGLRIAGCGRVDTPADVTLTLSNIVTYAGTFRKEGAGTLALAARPRFLSGAATDAPTSGTNVLEITAGAVKPLATNCLDGVRVRLAQTGTLLFDIAPTADGLRTFGIVNLSEPDAVPFESTANYFTDVLNVAFDTTASPDAPPSTDWSVALMTVPAATAEQLASRVRLTSGYPNYEAILNRRTNEDATVTLYANFRAIEVYTVTPQSAQTPLFTSGTTLAVPTSGHIVFSGWSATALSNAYVTVASAPAYSMPSDWANWTYEPAIEGRSLCFAEEDGKLVARIKADIRAYAKRAGGLVLSSLGESNAFAFITPGDHASEGPVAPSGENDFTFTNTTKVTDVILEGELSVRQMDAMRARAVWAFSPTISATRQELSCALVSFKLPTAYRFNALLTNGVTVTLTKNKETLLQDVSTLALRSTSSEKNFTLTFPTPIVVYAYLNTANALQMALYCSAPDTGFAKGETYAFVCDITASGAVKADMAQPLVYAANDEWIPTTAAMFVKAGSALDFNDLCDTGKPAGKHGRVRRVGNHFEFANRPGVPVRFVGAKITNTRSREPGEDPRYPDHVRRGYNATCCGAADDIFDTSDPLVLRIDEEKALQYDSYVACMISNGLYFTVSLYGNGRNPTWRALGEDRDGKPTYDEVKSLLLTHEGLVSNYLAAARIYLTHTNAYTGRCLLDEPALIGIDFAGEHYNGIMRVQDMGLKDGRDLQSAWSIRVAEMKAKYPQSAWTNVLDTIPASLTATDTGRFYGQFLREKVVAFEARVRRFIRDELHSDIALTNMQEIHPICFSDAQTSRDYIDMHFYEDHPSFLETTWSPPSTMAHGNVNPILVENWGVPRSAHAAHYGYPFVGTEFNYCAPGQFRMAGGLLMGATAALQDWSGIWHYTRNLQIVQQPMGYFSVMDDPLMPAFARAVLMLYARGDLPPLTNDYVTRLDPEGLRSAEANQKSTDWFQNSNRGSLAWYAKIGLAVTNELPTSLPTSGDWPTTKAKSKEQMLADLGLARDASGALPIAGGGHVRLDDKRGSIAVFTDRTCGGFAEGGAITAGVFSVELGDVPAAVWVSSCDKRPLTEARRMLLSYLTDVQDTGTRFLNDTRKTLLNFGKLPHLMRRAQGHVHLAIGRGSYRVFALAADGSRRFEVPYVSTADGLELTCDTALDPAEATYLYEIVRLNGTSLLFR